MATKSMPPVAILGAGLAGLTAANFLQRQGIPVVVFEAGKKVAGLAASFQEGGFTYDFGAHFITNRLAGAVGIAKRCRDVPYYGESVFLKGRHYRYPMGLLCNGRFLSSALAGRLGRSWKGRAPKSLDDHFCALYGKALAQEVAVPLVEAWSGVSATELAPSVADKLPLGIAKIVYLRMMSRLTGHAIAIGYGKDRPSSTEVWHVYPDGGTSLLCQRLAEPLKSSLHVESRVESIFVESDRAVGVRVNGRDYDALAVISTAPCNVLPKLIRGTNKIDYLSRFRFRPMTFVLLRLEGRNLLKDTVVWTPESAFPFFRLTETPISMPWLAPEGKTLITVDLGCETDDAIWKMQDEQLAALCLEQLRPLVPDIQKRYLGVRVLRTPIAYPIFLREYEDERRSFQQSTGIDGLHSIGRNGEFDHLLTEDVYWRTLTKANKLLPGLKGATPEPQLLRRSSASS